jgi:hypothetical protein
LLNFRRHGRRLGGLKNKKLEEAIMMKMFACAMILSGSLFAQEFPRFTFDVGGGFTNTVGRTGRYLDDGWNVGAGAGVNFFPYLGAMVQADFNSLGINSGTLNSLGFPGGDVKVFSASLEPIVHLNGHRRLDVYVTGGGGVYHL